MGPTKCTDFVLAGVLLVAIFLPATFCQDADGIYKIGTGIGDITGPAGGVVLNGYVNPLTLAAGIHTRQHARSFIVESIDSGNAIVFVSCDMGMIEHSIKLEVIKKLKPTFGEKYTENNVMISATHTHSGASGFMQHYAYLVIESYGFNPLSFWSIVDGIVDSIKMADAALTRGRVLKNKGELLGYNGNRAMGPYNLNPQEERDMYEHPVDKEMMLLKFESVDNQGNSVEPLGCFTWWPVHPISFNGAFNPLISSDNRGYAAVLFDYEMNKGAAARPGRGKFVAAFASANLGDVSPRTGNGKILDDEKRNVRIVGTAQFEKAFELFNDEANLKQLKGPIKFVHQYIDMPSVVVDVPNSETGITEERTLCKAGLGYGYVGLDPSIQPIWDVLLELLQAEASEEMVECQKPKLVAVPAGEMGNPWEWAPSIVDLQVLRLGNADIVSMPGELTTMAGRRLRRALQPLVPADHEVILAGLANIYINYVATPEEYDAQESEGGATIYGRHTLDGIIKIHKELVTALNQGAPVPPGPTPPNFTERLRANISELADGLPPNDKFWGQEVSRPQNLVYTGQTMIVLFVTPSLRHDPLRTKSHFYIQRLNTVTGQWEDVRTDADLDTTFWWNAFKREGEVVWYDIPHDTVPGTYRVYHSGYYLENAGEGLKQFEGTSETFMLRVHPSIATEAPTTPGDGEPNSASINFVNRLVIGVLFLVGRFSMLN